MRHDGPDDACHLVGQRHRCNLYTLSFLQDPGPGQLAIRPVLASGHRRHGALHQQRPDIGITALADPQQSRLATGRILARYQPQPGGQFPAIFKVVGITNGGYQYRGDSWADTRYLHQALTDGVLVSHSLDLQVSLFDLAVLLDQRLSQFIK